MAVHDSSIPQYLNFKKRDRWSWGLELHGHGATSAAADMNATAERVLDYHYGKDAPMATSEDETIEAMINLVSNFHKIKLGRVGMASHHHRHRRPLTGPGAVGKLPQTLVYSN